ncbi:hypothetical protein K493DRAFT_310808 [Basidiobolus meristosporus CBS 931.73]|uniref:Uncharacterized protein n=1 Tax=Basidiobolus meristosporus CBS 931.73 TaxID=1314790 RepID=A0A1Y1Z6G8_9FUNG|nr:hypothetical protein K493DRAFT_310808 [Basidiobolus meristosporus CBS 931.73]|eukprot:ORY05853.1 hypothetical protein K493DRAFT_310808 [Basidiobolus meristosporus CBS 931.73]
MHPSLRTRRMMNAAMNTKISYGFQYQPMYKFDSFKGLGSPRITTANMWEQIVTPVNYIPSNANYKTKQHSVSKRSKKIYKQEISGRRTVTRTYFKSLQGKGLASGTRNLHLNGTKKRLVTPHHLKVVLNAKGSRNLLLEYSKVLMATVTIQRWYREHSKKPRVAVTTSSKSQSNPRSRWSFKHSKLGGKIRAFLIRLKFKRWRRKLTRVPKQVHS